MKKGLLFIAALMLTLTATAKVPAADNCMVKKQMEGVWQQVIVDHAGNIKQYIPFLKIFNENGTYIHMQMTNGKPAFFNATGKWKVKSGNTLFEYVDIRQGKKMDKYTEEHVFHIEERPNGTFMYNHYHTIGKKMNDISEVWIKCDFSAWDIMRQRK